jgi:hypothetical protein
MTKVFLFLDFFLTSFFGEDYSYVTNDFVHLFQEQKEHGYE